MMKLIFCNSWSFIIIIIIFQQCIIYETKFQNNCSINFHFRLNSQISSGKIVRVPLFISYMFLVFLPVIKTTEVTTECPRERKRE